MKIQYSIYSDSHQEWHNNGLSHREDGPAIILPDGTQAWYKNHKLHREDGPAIIWADGRQEWYQNGERCTSLCWRKWNSILV